MNASTLKIATLWFLLFPFQNISAQEEIEEIIVIGEKSLRSFRNQWVIAEDNFYDMYNSLNEDNEYDVICRMRSPIGSLIKKRECIPAFTVMKTAGLVKSLMFGVPYPSGELSILKKKNIFHEKMKTITEANPILLETLIELSNAKNKYQEVRKERFEESWINY